MLHRYISLTGTEDKMSEIIYACTLQAFKNNLYDFYKQPSFFKKLYK